MRSKTRAREVEPGVTLRRFFTKMLSAFGPQNWWPARTRLEVILGAILVQNTAWQNAARAVKLLRLRGFLDLERLRQASPSELEACVRPAGFYRQKARTIRGFLEWLDGGFGGSLARMFALAPQESRRQLLKVRGFGPETVDAILLYAGQHAFFVADSYTRRVLARHALIPPEAGYRETQEFLHANLPADPELFNEYHALLVEVGKRYCRSREPRCGECPLEEFLTPDQPVALPASVKRAH